MDEILDVTIKAIPKTKSPTRKSDTTNESLHDGNTSKSRNKKDQDLDEPAVIPNKSK